ncbi:galactose ABC transporter substrate-binding protein [Paenibacillus sp. JDR-2]|uniref:galactose ABC transporter substrate-binding protein n=1 Tax=Paenibacillus sp. (strain JDR-2) TaxID=324057 RepID=UPI000166A430|nr:galactose ABC transporter substrate-binding protein [Paenibacillus sp. JDR-2]ACT00514.1 D-galactose/D-glucose ABC transporter, periplasmic D-galactose/D-glucose-binding protein [Paenibacillus sp. JDR-2]
MKKKKWIPAVCAGALAVTVLAACGNNGGENANQNAAANNSKATAVNNTAAESPAVKKEPTVGVAIYKFDDTFMTGVRNAIEAASQGVAKVDIVDSQNSQPTQNDKVDLFITKKYNAMAINAVDRTAASMIIDKAKSANTPVVFFNREPLAEDMNKWDLVYYVGAKAEESGTMSGELIIDYWKAHPEMDKNKDGKLQYIMLKGEPGHQDAELRTKYSIQAITDAGIGVEKLAEDTAMWDRVKAQDKMATFLSAHGDKIEAVLANNDDMALGAIEALKAAGYFKDGKFMPVVGVDATAAALQALSEGTLLGTVLNDAKNQGAATLKLAAALANGETPSKVNTGFDITDSKYVWVPYKKITKDNMSDAQ